MPLENNFKKALKSLLYSETGIKYMFLKSKKRKWGTKHQQIQSGAFYQVIPEEKDDGFFKWYLTSYAYKQRYKTISAAVSSFLFHRQEWVMNGEHSIPNID